MNHLNHLKTFDTFFCICFLSFKSQHLILVCEWFSLGFWVFILKSVKWFTVGGDGWFYLQILSPSLSIPGIDFPIKICHKYCFNKSQFLDNVKGVVLPKYISLQFSHQVYQSFYKEKWFICISHCIQTFLLSLHITTWFSVSNSLLNAFSMVKNGARMSTKINFEKSWGGSWTSMFSPPVL